MSKLDLLKNTGVLELNKPQTHLPEKTVVVLGVARGGTTMVASVLETLGVYMGENLGPVKEDVALSLAVEAGDSEQINKIVSQRDAAHPIWGWKRPSAIEHSAVWKEKFRNPYIIAVFRDPFAIANRNRISMLSDVFQNMGRAVQHLDSLVRFLQDQQCPVLLCSYEKVLSSPETFVRDVDEFLDLQASDRWNEAILQINPASKEYLESSRITHSTGCLEVANEQYCCGWAFYPKQLTRHAKVDLFINEQLVHTVVARQLRSDIKDSGKHPTGNCGFRFEWPEGVQPKLGDKIVARVEGDIAPLKGSPMQIKARTLEEGKGGAIRPIRARPSFYGMGSQKAVATWLCEVLKKHPQIHLPSSNSLHYWDAHSDRPLQWYLDHFEGGLINGDITPAYASLPETTISEIHELTPQARIVFLMQNPIDRAWSTVLREISLKYGKFPDDLLAGKPSEELADFIRQKLFQPSFLSRSNYARTIRRWRKFFDHDAMLCISDEQIGLNPRALLFDICQHIGADTAWVDGLTQDAIKKMPLLKEEIPFPSGLRAEYVERCVPFIDDLEQLLGIKLDDWRK